MYDCTFLYAFSRQHEEDQLDGMGASMAAASSEVDSSASLVSNRPSRSKHIMSVWSVVSHLGVTYFNINARK